MIIFVNGYTLGCQPFRPYWSSSNSPNEFIEAAQNYFNDFHLEPESFVNGSGKWFGSLAKCRFKAGKKYAIANIAKYQSLLTISEKIHFVSHSMGAAFAEGMIAAFSENNFPIGKIVHFSPAHARKITISENTLSFIRLQINTTDDSIIERFADPFTSDEKKYIKGVTFFGKVNWDPWKYHPEHMEYVTKIGKKHQQHPHFDTKTFAFVFDWLTDLEELCKTVDFSASIIQNSVTTNFQLIAVNNTFFKFN